MVRDCVIFGDMFMTLLTFPRTLEDICYLFKYSGHNVLGNVVTYSFRIEQVYAKSCNCPYVRYMQTRPGCAGSISS